MKIGVGIIAYNVSKELDKLLCSLAGGNGRTQPGMKGHEVVCFLHQHSTRESQPEVTAVCELYAEESWVHYTYHGMNRGLAASWNDQLIQGYEEHNCDIVILVNDDIQFLPGSLDSFAEYAVAHRDAFMVTTLGYHHHYAQHTEQLQQALWGFGFSCFAVNPIALETIGYFDGNLAPIYDEDCDYGERAYRAGLHAAEHKGTGVIHWGSLSMQTAEQQIYLQGKNVPRRDYFARKWGLDYDFEAGKWNRYFDESSRAACPTPFNRPEFSLKIEKDDRHRPYGPLFDRFDIEGREPLSFLNEEPTAIIGMDGNPIPLIRVKDNEWIAENCLPVYTSDEQGHVILDYRGQTTKLSPDYVPPKTDQFPFRPGCGGNSIWSHMERLAEFARLSNGVIVEIGLGCGDGSTHAFQLGLQQNPAEYKRHIGVSDHPVGQDWEPESSYWSFVKGDSRNTVTVKHAGNHLSEIDAGRMIVHKPGIIYIDTEHSYECLKRELEIWPDIGDENTLYLFHDVHYFAPMTEAIHEAVAVGGRFHDTHDYVLISKECSGLGALVPKSGWGR